MARLITTSGYDRALIGGFVASEETRRRKEKDRETFRETLSRYRGREYIERFDDRSRALDIDKLARRATAINRMSRSAFRDDMIMDLLDIADAQHASRTMQNYLLSDRRIGYLARNQRIEAWQRDMDEFDYPDPSYNPHYRQMMDGFMVDSEHDSKDMQVTEFLCMEDEDRISYTEQRSIHYSRERIMEMLQAKGEDPTSKMNNLL